MGRRVVSRGEREGGRLWKGTGEEGGGVPQDDEALWELLERMRSKKDAVFEACITDRARETFKQ